MSEVKTPLEWAAWVKQSLKDTRQIFDPDIIAEAISGAKGQARKEALNECLARTVEYTCGCHEEILDLIENKNDSENG